MSSPVQYDVIDNIGVIAIDNPPVNALSAAVRGGIVKALESARSDDSEALLIICRGRTFCAGADITEFGKPPVDPSLPEVVDAIEASPKLVVAALHGTALGGGLEVAMGCHYRCATADARVGLPEVKLGLLPGAGGTQRTPRLAGVAAAVEMMTSGNPFPAKDAAAAGLIDHIVDGDLEAGAMAWVKSLLAEKAPIRRASELPIAADAGAVLDGLREKVARKARGQNAPLRILDCVEAAITKPFDEGAKIEREQFMACMQDPQSAALRHVFFAERNASRIRDLAPDTPQRPIESVAIIGAGTMGGGIAMSAANAGFVVHLVDIDDEAIARGLAVIDRNYAGTVKHGKLTEEQAKACRARIRATTDYADIADADLVIEAVFENLDLKKKIFGRLDETMKDGAILATNTSYQDVDAIAAATGRPQDVIGLHFFSPAHIMKLLEIVRGEKTADDVLATAMAVAKKLRKVPVLSRVCYGFIGNRMLRIYMREAQLCLLECRSPETVDGAMEAWGMAMGPMAVGDLAGLDVGYKARESIPPEHRGEPITNSVSDTLVEAGRLGQKTGAGFYKYDPDTRRRLPDPEVVDIIEKAAAEYDVPQRDIDGQEIVDRLIFGLANEGHKIVGEGIAQRPGDVDIVYVYGYGFPAWRGGPLHYADAVGLDHVLARIREFGERFGAERWEPAPLLEQLVNDKQSLAEWAAGNAP
ncbi:MAG: 3-hydroxyacyl-CoA dehydrogenase NAD-binding domain-containing protein [Woeseiaceae bacterium]